MESIVNILRHLTTADQRRRFAVTRQHDSMQCGAACLQMICRHYGRSFTLKTMTERCHVTNTGVSMLGISRAAESVGLDNVTGKVTLAKLTNDTLPCILHWNQNHFVVLYHVRSDGRYDVADPGKGRVTYTAAQMRDHWIAVHDGAEEKGVAMFFEPTEKFFEQTDEQPPKSRHLHTLLSHIGTFRRDFLILALLLLAGSLLQLVVPFLTQAIVDVGITQHDIGLVWLILMGQLVLTLSRTIADFVRRRVLLRISISINISLISRFFQKLLRLPMSFFETKLMGDLMQRMGDHGRVNQFLTQQAISILFSLLSMVVFSVVLCIYDWRIFLVFLAGSLLYGGWLMVFLPRRKILDYEYFEQQARNNNQTYQLLTTMQEIKLQGCERRRRKEWEDVQRDLFSVQSRSLSLQQKEEVGALFINESKNIVITAMSAAAVISGDLTLGMMLAVQYIIGQLNVPVLQLLGLFYTWQDVNISMNRIGEIQETAEEDAERHQRKLDGTHDIVLEHVSFRYDPFSATPTLSDLSLTVPEGCVTAIVGASGSGKTTLVKMLLGFYPVETGKILVGGCDLADINLQWWRSQCGVVMQDGVLFSESIVRNIAVSDEEVDMQRVDESARIACIRDHVLSLPLKYETKIGRDGMGLSQGQKQRILIARAIYRNPSFVFLDEATNSLDATNEQQIVNNLRDYYAGRTVVIIAHRLSTVKTADQIVVMNSGRVVEQGNHATLLKYHGVYWQLVKNQM